MTLQNKKIMPIIELGIIVGAITFILTIITTTFWQSEGISVGETIMLPLVGGFYLFFTILTVNIIGINKIRRVSIKKNELTFKKLYQVLIILMFSVLIYTLLDFIYFLLDDSLSKDYANSLEALMKSTGEKTDDFKDFEKLPFSIQNIFSSLFSSIVAGIISLAFIKNNGEIFNNKKDNNYQ
jgi:hypothetical protein